MPAQTVRAKTVYFTEYDTAPALRACLKDGQDEPIDLTSATVAISIAFAMPRGSYYTNPRQIIVPYAPCVVDPDQVANTGWVSWTPGPTDGVDALTPPGQFLYQFTITYPGGGSQTIPSDTYLPLVIKTRVGGRQANP
jgi:hypothetical protein